jgi:hypothetical protein
LLRFLKRQRDKKEIIWPYNFKWVLLSSNTFYFAHQMLKFCNELYLWHCIFKRAQLPLYSYRH